VHQEIEELEVMAGRIVKEMKEFLKVNAGVVASVPVMIAPVVVAPVAVAAAAAPVVTPSPLVTLPSAKAGGEAKSLTSLAAAAGPSDKEHNSEEGEEYDGTGGLGLAKGTVNTYVLPGMDEMTGEEYRAALQASVSARQARRRTSGEVGNRQSQNYLDNLKKDAGGVAPERVLAVPPVRVAPVAPVAPVPVAVAPVVASSLPHYATASASATSSPLVTLPSAKAGGEAKSLTSLAAAAGPSDKEHNSEEGEEYDGTGGLGLAKGTVNTYVLPGMDEMTGEEYRAALQASVSARQERRRMSGQVGNRQSQNYLDAL